MMYLFFEKYLQAIDEFDDILKKNRIVERVKNQY